MFKTILIDTASSTIAFQLDELQKITATKKARIETKIVIAICGGCGCFRLMVKPRTNHVNPWNNKTSQLCRGKTVRSAYEAICHQLVKWHEKYIIIIIIIITENWTTRRACLPPFYFLWHSFQRVVQNPPIHIIAHITSICKSKTSCTHEFFFLFSIQRWSCVKFKFMIFSNIKN